MGERLLTTDEALAVIHDTLERTRRHFPDPSCDELADRLHPTEDDGGDGPQFGWVIEHRTSEPSQPWYWIGDTSWSYHHAAAVRFARRVDAETVSRHLGRGGHRVCQHQWG